QGRSLLALCTAHKRVAPLTSKTGQRDKALGGDGAVIVAAIPGAASKRSTRRTEKSIGEMVGRSKGVVVSFTGADPHGALNRRHEDLAVAGHAVVRIDGLDDIVGDFRERRPQFSSPAESE